VLAPALTDQGVHFRRAVALVAEHELSAPELIDLEVLSALRRLVRAEVISEAHAASSLRELALMPLARSPHAPLVGRIWELRDNLSAYDAAYVALAERVEGSLVTADSRLAAAPGIRCEIELLS